MLTERFDRLAAIRGDTTKGLATSAWNANLGDLDRDQLLRAAIAATRALILPEWESKRTADRRPQQALEAVEAWLAKKTDDNANAAKAAAKECTAARNETFGYDHRIPEAARAIAWAVTAKDNTPIWEALGAIEEELLARIQLVAEYHRAPEQRRALLGALRNVLEPKQAEAEPDASGPVPYAASGSYRVGQQLTHVKFGLLTVSAVQGTTIEVTLEDGSVKKLAHKPK